MTDTDTPGEPVAALAIRHAAHDVERRERRWFVAAGAVMIVAAAGSAGIGLLTIPLGIGAFVAAGRSLGRRRRARRIAEASGDDAVEWTIAGRRVTGRRAGGRDHDDLELVLPGRIARGMRALPAARVITVPVEPGQATSSTPPATER